MAFTLEAAIVIPVTMGLTVSMISLSVKLYRQIETESHAESVSLVYPIENNDLWSCEAEENLINKTWSKKISVNPVKVKETIDFAIDTAAELKDLFPLLDGMEGIALEK